MVRTQKVSCSAKIAACMIHHTIPRTGNFTRECFTTTESAECHSKLLKKWGTRSAQGSHCFILKVYSRTSDRLLVWRPAPGMKQPQPPRFLTIFSGPPLTAIAYIAYPSCGFGSRWLAVNEAYTSICRHPSAKVETSTFAKSATFPTPLRKLKAAARALNDVLGPIEFFLPQQVFVEAMRRRSPAIGTASLPPSNSHCFCMSGIWVTSVS